MKNFSLANNFNLNDIILVLSLSDTGSMSATARELNIDVSTVSRRVTVTEKALGTLADVAAITFAKFNEAYIDWARLPALRSWFEMTLSRPTAQRGLRAFDPRADLTN